jgi:transposase
MPQNFLFPQRDQPLLLPADMREWLPEDDLVFVVLDAVATLDLGEFRRRYRADGHGRAAFGPEMTVALLLYGYCQGERSSRVIEKRCVRGVGYRVITGGLHPDHATIARFRARHERALGGLFSQVLRLLAAEGMVSLGVISLDGTKLAGNAAQKANRTLPQIGKLLAEAAAADAAEDARLGGKLEEPGPQALARRAERRERLVAARERLAAEDRARRDAQRARQEAWDAAAAAGKRGGRRPGDEPRTNRNNTEPRANITDPDCRVMRNQKGYVAGYNGQLVVTADQVIVGVMLSQHPVDRTLLHPLLDRCRDQLAEAGIQPRLRTVLADSGYASPRRRRRPAAARAAGQRSRPALCPDSATRPAPGPASGHRPGPAAPAPSSRPGGLQAARPHRRTSVRAAQDLPETDHDVPARPGRVRERMAAGLRRAQSAQAAPPPPGGLTVKGPSPAARTQDHPRARSRTRYCVPRSPSLGLHTALRDRLNHATRLGLASVD